MVISTRAGMVVCWANAWLGGLVSLDDAASYAGGPDRAHRVIGVPDEPQPVSWSVALGRLRGAAVTRFLLSLPAPGDPLGLAGPPAFNADATAAGAAVLAVAGDRAYGAVPVLVGPDMTWELRPVAPPAVDTPLRETERELADVLRDATAELEALDLARSHPELQSELARSDRELRSLQLPPGLPPNAVRMIMTATRLEALVGLALRADGAAVTAAEARRRQDAVRPVSAAARRALVSAYAAHDLSLQGSALRDSDR